VNRVARIYRPQAVNPLMETSVDQMLRAGSRAFLHLLIVLDRLPLNLHEESLATLHSYVRNAIRAWDTYSAAEPYLSHAGRAMYVGRYLAGASPLTVGITWALSELGKRSAKALGKRVLDQQAVALIGDVVRIIGFEVASIYSTDFRYRTPDWIYGSELTDLASRFPISRESLAHSLREVGTLSLRNEYDRIFLYRCLSTHRAARPLVSAHQLLPAEQRRDIARRLETFYRDFIHGRTAKRVEGWVEAAEKRLGVRLEIQVPASRGPAKKPGQAGAAAPVSSASDDSLRAVGSLAGFVSAVKGRPVRALSGHFGHLKTAGSVGESGFQSMIEQLEADPPQLFDPPDIDPKNPVLDAYFDDLVMLAVEMPPRDLKPDEFVLETAAYFGTDIKAIRKKLDQAYLSFVNQQLPGGAPALKISPSTARQLIQFLPEHEPPQFVYSGVKIRRSGSDQDLPREGVLAGTPTQLFLLIPGDPPGLAVSDQSGFSVEKVTRMMIDDCRLSGGNWRTPESVISEAAGEVVSGFVSAEGEALTLTIPGAVMSRFDSWFQPLVAIARQT